MTSNRKSIRAACVALIKAGSTAAAQRVFPSRVFPIWKLTYPVICVYTPNEDYTILGQFPTIAERKLRVSVQLVDGNVDTDVEDRLDDLSDEIEAILDNDDNWGSPDIGRIEYVGCDMEMVYDREADKNYAALTMNFDVFYQTQVVPVAPPNTAYVEVNGTWIPEDPPVPGP
jgi:hypothetical protein